MSGVAEERVARRELQQTGEADIWAEKFGVVIPPTEVVVELAREGLVELVAWISAPGKQQTDHHPSKRNNPECSP